MTSPESRQYIQDVLDSITQIRVYFSGKTALDLEEDDMLFDAITMRLQVIGESVKKLPPPLLEEYPDIRWREIIALRNYISHAYSFLDAKRFYHILVDDLPKLEIAVKDMALRFDTPNNKE